MVRILFYGVVKTWLVNSGSLRTIEDSSPEALNVLDLTSIFSVTTKSETKSFSLVQEALNPRVLIDNNKIKILEVVLEGILT
jgi:sulfur relay (sulfurtransferase) DsrF/TusC family protein